MSTWHGYCMSLDMQHALEILNSVSQLNMITGTIIMCCFIAYLALESEEA